MGSSRREQPIAEGGLLSFGDLPASPDDIASLPRQSQLLPTYRDAVGRKRWMEPRFVAVVHAIVHDGVKLTTACRRHQTEVTSVARALRQPAYRAYLDELVSAQLALGAAMAPSILARNLLKTKGFSSNQAAKELLDRGTQAGRMRSGQGVSITINLGSQEDRGEVIDVTPELEVNRLPER